MKHLFGGYFLRMGVAAHADFSAEATFAFLHLMLFPFFRTTAEARWFVVAMARLVNEPLLIDLLVFV